MCMKFRGLTELWLKPSNTDLTIYAKSPIFSCHFTKGNSRLLPFYGSKLQVRQAWSAQAGKEWVSLLAHSNPISKDLSLQRRQSYISMLGYRPGRRGRKLQLKRAY